ncbi:MAG: hypothetical protein DLM61_19455 [Pseudonocardiales bacterium]|nr:MAG: hypothetical protein DLM61_19455 [Pseudonocardiales bacterium]
MTANTSAGPSSTSGVVEPDYVYDGVGVFEAPIFDLEVDATGRDTTVRLRAGAGGSWTFDDVASVRRLAAVLIAAADYADSGR